MRPGREVDTQIAQEVFGHKVWARGKVLLENPEAGERPLRRYSKEMEWAWTVAEKMHVTLIPIIGGEWFAFIGPKDQAGWDSPQAVLQFLDSGKFAGCSAAVGTDAPWVICQAALNALAKRKSPEQASNVVQMPAAETESTNVNLQ